MTVNKAYQKSSFKLLVLKLFYELFSCVSSVFSNPDLATVILFTTMFQKHTRLLERDRLDAGHLERLSDDEDIFALTISSDNLTPGTT